MDEWTVEPGTKLRRRILPSVEYLREHFSYDPETGLLVRTKRTGPRTYIGEVVSDKAKFGLSGKFFNTSRVIWKMQTGQEPPVAIDHEDGDGLNFRWKNLRASCYTRNAQNRAFRRDLSTTGHKGVRLNTDRPNSPRKFVADITVNRKRKKLGAFVTLEEAIAAREAAEVKYFGAQRTDRVLDGPMKRLY